MKGLSYRCGEAKTPLLYETIGDHFDRIVEAHRDREALVVVHQGIRWTYGAYHAQVEALATGTPVAAFEGTGPATIIEHQKSGYLAKAFDGAGLAQGLRWLLEAGSKAPSMEAAKARAQAFAQGRAARSYRALYEAIASEATASQNGH